MKTPLIVAILFLSSLFSSSCTPKPSSPLPSIPVAYDGAKVFNKIQGAVFSVEKQFQDEWFLIGTSFVIKYNNKFYFITAKHVVDDSETKYRIVDHLKNSYEIKSINHSEIYDLAILEVDHKPKTHITLARENPKIGSECYAIGNPLGVLRTITEGVVAQYFEEYLVASAQISPGSSGGVLVDKNGHLLGVASAVNVEWDQFNLFVPLEDLKKFLDKSKD